MFQSVLIANRGEIAARIIRSLKRLRVRAIAVASDADRFTLPMRMADRVLRLPGNAVADTYLNAEAIIAACRESGAEAVHPGYGFLSENPEFAECLAAEGIVFIGPKPDQIRAFGLKHTAREIAAKCGIPLLPGSGLLSNLEHALAEAENISYPVMLKSTAGGGGIGMQLCRDAAELAQRYANVARFASANFGDARLYLERFVPVARHVEVQIFGDGKGGIVVLGERDCSIQRRNQKVVEETPAPNLPARVRDALRNAAIALGKAVNYESAGTVEFVYDVTREEAYFLEVNTRLQVEHPVTEEIFGVDLVEWMIRQAAGEFVLPPTHELNPNGHAIEVRLYAEDPARDFRPSTGLITGLTLPKNVRVESWIETGTEISPHYDPMLAKLIVHGQDRTDAVLKLRRALEESALWGIESNLDYLKTLAATDFFRSGDVATSKLKEMDYRPRSIEVLTPGTQSSLQDWPGRIGYWEVGIPPSGPMDDRSHRLVNRILGNPEQAATLECTLNGPALRFLTNVTFALGGAEMAATLDGKPLPYWAPVPAKRGQVLALGAIAGAGLRTYLGVAGGFDAPLYLNSRATFALGGFGGHAGRMLKAGDMLRIGSGETRAPYTPSADEIPRLEKSWEIGVLYGPHGAPDFFTRGDIETLFSSEYEVHFNSARTGVRLIGPAPQWARSDGGEAGLHPSNIHDNAYAIGAIDFTGDMPIILGPDGPSLGGFVCPAALAQGELWKLGQLRPGDRVRFRNITLDDAATLRKGASLPPARVRPDTDRLRNSGDVVYRRAGDDNILVEFGPMQLDLRLRMRAHLLMQALREYGPRGIIDLTPGIRSLQIHYDNGALSEAKLLDTLAGLERELPDPADAVVKSRTVYLPLSWNDPQAQLAMRKYQELVRPNAPWCPSNIEFIRRINGLDSEDDVRRIVFDAEYLVLGLGDVYLGAPVATPVDPRHRLVTTKYNPARTWTPENAVGIGGAYLCVYGMEGPGGYQLFGRTVQMWNRWRATDCFEEGKPWLLRFFDRIRFFPVTAEELLEARAAFPHGCYPLRIEDGEFRLSDHERYLATNAREIASARARQQRAFAVERVRWRELGLDTYIADETVADEDGEGAIPANATPVHAPTAATVWKIEATLGQRVNAGQVLIIVESMKTEIAVEAPIAGVVSDIRCHPGRAVHAGQTLALIESTP
jgi:urea carboxylase